MKGRVRVMQPFPFAGFAFVFAFVFGLGASNAVQADCKPEKSESVEVSVIAPDGVLTLADGRALRLAALEPPIDMQALAGWTNVITKIRPARVTLHLGDKPEDRYGQLQGLLARADGQLVEALLLRDGLARVSPRADMRFCLAGLLQIEDEARKAHRGLWAEVANLPLQATDIAGLEAREGQFALVEGVVTDAVNRKGRLFLNFGSDWRTDFTVTVAAADARLFRDARIKVKKGTNPAMKGERVRVRGYIERYNGPDMVLTTPEQLEFLKPAEKAGRMHDVGKLGAK